LNVLLKISVLKRRVLLDAAVTHQLFWIEAFMQALFWLLTQHLPRD
jgi:hypothetical protein